MKTVATLTAVTLLAMTAALAACGTADDAPAQQPEEPVAEPTAEATAQQPGEPIDEPTAEATAQQPEDPIAEPTEEPAVEPTATPEPGPFDAETTYLDRVVPPCVAPEGSSIDPCERRDNVYEKIEDFVEKEIEVVQTGQTLYDMLTDDVSRVLDIEHLIIRAVFIPGTTRCAPYPYIRGNYDDEGEAFAFSFSEPGYINNYCFVDAAVREYLAGKGPERITVMVNGLSPGYWHEMFGDDQEKWRELVEDPIARSYEGYEWIFGLRTPRNLAYAGWELGGAIWDVQRREDGIVMVTDIYKDLVEELFEDPIGVEHTLEEFTREVKRAYAKVLEERGTTTGQRFDAHFAIDDANLKFLKQHYVQYRAWDFPDVATPASVPEIEGPSLWEPGTNVNDIEGTPAAPDLPE